MPIITSKYGTKTVTRLGITGPETTIEVYADGQHLLTLERGGDDGHWQCERDGKTIGAAEAMNLLQWIADDAEASTLTEFAQLYPGFQLPQPSAGPVVVHVLSQNQAGYFTHPLFAHVATPPTHPLRYTTYQYDYPEATQTGVGCGRCTDQHGQAVKHATREHVSWCYSQFTQDESEHAAELWAERGHPQHMVW